LHLILKEISRRFITTKQNGVPGRHFDFSVKKKRVAPHFKGKFPVVSENDSQNGAILNWLSKYVQLLWAKRCWRHNDPICQNCNRTVKLRHCDVNKASWEGENQSHPHL